MCVNQVQLSFSENKLPLHKWAICTEPYLLDLQRAKIAKLWDYAAYW